MGSPFQQVSVSLLYPQPGLRCPAGTLEPMVPPPSRFTFIHVGSCRVQLSLKELRSPSLLYSVYSEEKLTLWTVCGRLEPLWFPSFLSSDGDSLVLLADLSKLMTHLNNLHMHTVV